MSLPDIKGSSILIVDDVIDNLNILADMLVDQGHEVRIALNGPEALEVMEQKLPDLVLLDIQMPMMNGYEVCTRIKANEKTQDIPVIFLSAHAETSDIVKGFEVGGVDYVSKPFKFREVIARVQNQLAISQQRKEIEALRERDRQQFEKLTKMKDRFLHMTAHDLKNPLTGVLLYSQHLKTNKAEVDNLDEIAEAIELSARKMQRLITDILDLAQMQVGEGLDLFLQDVKPIILQSIQDFEIIAKEHNIQLSTSLPDGVVKLYLNQTQFERVLDNLISNAIKYTNEGGSVHVKLEIFDEQVEISVIDNGLGIPQEDINHLFEAFYRVRKATHRKETGSGLGLSIVQAIVEQHNGVIQVTSELEVGSTFTVILPHP